MKRKLLLFVLISILVSAGSAKADSEFYVIASGGGAVGTKITSAPYEIKSPGFYYLGGNLTYSGSTYAITVSSDNVTLDLMGFSLTNSGVVGSTSGFRMVDRSNVEIRNGTVRGFLYGISEASIYGNKHRIINVRAHGNTDGIGISGYNHLIKGCTASDNTGTGIVLHGGLVIDCVASNNDTGIRLWGPGNVLGNVVFNNFTHNFNLGNAGATAIMVDRNSGFGLNPNYYVVPNTIGVQWGINAGAP